MPLNHIAKCTETQPPGPRTAPVAKARVLLADDNPAVLRHVSAMLSKDFEIVAALSDGESALRNYLELKADVLILDISMGRVSGLDVARTLKERGYSPHLIFLTVHQEPDFVKAAMACGASGYVVKSHLTNDLIPAIKATLAGSLFLSPCLINAVSVG
jgi:DNA-binding NarL/FixJ family response regulator